MFFGSDLNVCSEPSLDDIHVIPGLISIFSPEILFDNVTNPSKPIIESPILSSEITQKSVPFTEATETEVCTKKSFPVFT